MPVELFNKEVQDRLKLRAFLNLMSTCKAMYNYCLNSLVRRAMISISWVEPAELKVHKFDVKLTFKNDIILMFDCGCSDITIPLKNGCPELEKITLTDKNINQINACFYQLNPSFF